MLSTIGTRDTEINNAATELVQLRGWHGPRKQSSKSEAGSKGNTECLGHRGQGFLMTLLGSRGSSWRRHLEAILNLSMKDECQAKSSLIEDCHP